MPTPREIFAQSECVRFITRCDDFYMVDNRETTLKMKFDDIVPVLFDGNERKRVYKITYVAGNLNLIVIHFTDTTRFAIEWKLNNDNTICGWYSLESVSAIDSALKTTQKTEYKTDNQIVAEIDGKSLRLNDQSFHIVMDEHSLDVELCLDDNWEAI